MSLADIVNISISLATAGVAAAGFGVPLILSHSATWVERTRTYTSLAGVVADFATSTPEYKAAAAIFSQQVSPPSVMIGRAANAVAQSWTIGVHTVGAGNYQVRIGATTYAFLADGTATNDSIIAALAAAIGSISNLTVTTPGSSSAHKLRLVAASNKWFAVEAMSPGVMLDIVQDQADPGVAADLAAILQESDKWYALETTFNSKLYVAAAAAWIEANGRVYVASSQDSDIISTVKSGATDIAATLQTSALARTAVAYHPASDGFLDSGWEGRCLPLDPGSETWKFKTVATVPVYALNATQLANAAAKNCNTYQNVSNVNITAEGVVAAGEFIDVIRFRDWMKARMGERIFAKLINAKKIAFTDAGIGIIEAEVRGQLADGIAAGGLASDPAPTVTVPKAAAVSSANRTARNLAGLTFTGTLAGAIHTLTINGTITD